MSSDRKSELTKLANEWISWDINENDKKEMESLLKSGNWEELDQRLTKRISFGTAGLRGAMKAGASCMNDLTVLQASQGLCTYLERNVDGLKEKGIVLGYDGRYNSKRFADLTAAAFLSRGVKVYQMTRLAATPFVPFLVNLKGAAGGIMVTASHNPKDDNGYKVYWSNGAQIVEPHDKGIAKCIEENLSPWKDANYSSVDSFLEEKKKEGKLLDPTLDVEKHYFEGIAAKYCNHKEENKKAKLPIIYTPMHGVGGYWAAKAFESFGLPPFFPVPEQIEPDPAFPTVAFPNPEEGKGALSLSMKAADQHSSRLVIANDPDADRLAVAEKQKNGEWKIFTGNEIGIILGHWAWTQYKSKHPDVDPSKCAVLNSTVSSKMLASMAKKEGLYYEETLTGFKWLGNKAEQLQKEGKIFIFAFEEAIGFMIGDICLDKDGIRSAAVFAEMANWIDSNLSRTCSEQLDYLFKEYGYFATNNRYFFCYDPKVMETIFGRIRNGNKYPTSVGKYKVKNIRDLTTGFDDSKPDQKAALPTSSSTHMITFTFENGCVVTLRGSGTEPKLKYYAELSGTDKEQVVSELNDVVAQIIQHLLEPERNGLVPPKD
eukprot:TRINITY_DN8546_c0_g1_i1.p1 TRINITY_DN8546_c0_g1~~TRINITY_DN8546_c0_g1_i1.p1  ORF type:complete len:601 (-),score=248.95 TRINITY_DN8546_c0_g1_i1:41-1843(-)